MDPYKLERQNSTIRKALSEIITVEMKDPRVAFVSVNEVRLNRDQSTAEVYVSVIGEKQEWVDAHRGLKQARGFLQGRISDLLRLRKTPDLRFVLDDSFERSIDVDARLEELANEGEFDDEITRARKRTLDSFIPPKDLLEALAAAERPWIVPHWNPDPDAMGSALALARALDAAGKDPRVLGYPDPPVGLSILPGMDDVLMSSDVAEAWRDETPDLVIMVDCHALDRAEDLAEILVRVPNLWCIDHHLIDEGRAPLPGWIDAVASSASLLIYRVIETLASGEVEGCPAFEIDTEMAGCIYAGLVADTGGFRHSNTIPVAFEAALELSGYGINTTELAEVTLHRKTRESLELMKLVMGTFTFHADGRILSLKADLAMLKASGAVMSDTEGFVNLATSVEGVQFVIFQKEREDGRWRISLRGTGDGDVRTIAANYGGGGHRLAAGCTMDGDAGEVLDDLLVGLAEQLR